jgi:hypothetical protein
VTTSQPRPARPGRGPSRGPGPVGLAARAVACYESAPEPAGPEPAGWRARAARAARVLAATLGVDPGHVIVVPDPDRVYGLLAIPEVRLRVAEPARRGRVFEFVPEYGTSDAFVLLAPCPGCARPVPAHRVGSLADLGRHLARPGAPDAEQFTSDPAHAPGCPHHRPDPRYATAHRAPPGRDHRPRRSGR